MSTNTLATHAMHVIAGIPQVHTLNERQLDALSLLGTATEMVCARGRGGLVALTADGTKIYTYAASVLDSLIALGLVTEQDGMMRRSPGVYIA